MGHQLRRPLHLVHGRLLPRRIRRLAVRSFAVLFAVLGLDTWIAKKAFVIVALLVVGVVVVMMWWCFVWILELQADGEQRIVRDAVPEHREPQPPADNVRVLETNSPYR